MFGIIIFIQASFSIKQMTVPKYTGLFKVILGVYYIMFSLLYEEDHMLLCKH